MAKDRTVTFTLKVADAGDNKQAFDSLIKGFRDAESAARGAQKAANDYREEIKRGNSARPSSVGGARGGGVSTFAAGYSAATDRQRQDSVERQYNLDRRSAELERQRAAQLRDVARAERDAALGAESHHKSIEKVRASSLRVVEGYRQMGAGIAQAARSVVLLAIAEEDSAKKALQMIARFEAIVSLLQAARNLAGGLGKLLGGGVGGIAGVLGANPIAGGAALAAAPLGLLGYAVSQTMKSGKLGEDYREQQRQQGSDRISAIVDAGRNQSATDLELARLRIQQAGDRFAGNGLAANAAMLERARAEQARGRIGRDMSGDFFLGGEAERRVAIAAQAERMAQIEKATTKEILDLQRERLSLVERENRERSEAIERDLRGAREAINAERQRYDEIRKRNAGIVESLADLSGADRIRAKRVADRIESGDIANFTKEDRRFANLLNRADVSEASARSELARSGLSSVVKTIEQDAIASQRALQDMTERLSKLTVDKGKIEAEAASAVAHIREEIQSANDAYISTFWGELRKSDLKADAERRAQESVKKIMQSESAN